MGKVAKHLEGRTQQDRKKVRKQLGSLKHLTVQPRTRLRYDVARKKFYTFLNHNSLELPRKRAALDGLLCEYLEHLWSEGEGRALASDTLASLQDTDPHLRGLIPGAWRLLKAWHMHEIPNRAAPLPELAMQSLAGYFIFHDNPQMALSILLGYYAMLRTGELLSIQNKDVAISSDQTSAVISLGYTKGGKRSGAAESVTVSVKEVIRRLEQWKAATPPGSFLTVSPTKWRSMFSKELTALQLDTFEFRPYSLRRGGATFWFAQHGQLDRILVQGRWLAVKTARTYINNGLAMLSEIHLPKTANRPFHTAYINATRTCLPAFPRPKIA